MENKCCLMECIKRLCRSVKDKIIRLKNRFKR
nr:MAG TPA: hypothetical protein [Ackermannviridae sp.]